jgi:hypothetical protein
MRDSGFFIDISRAKSAVEARIVETHNFGATYSEIADTLHTGRTQIPGTICLFNATGFTAISFASDAPKTRLRTGYE